MVDRSGVKKDSRPQNVDTSAEKVSMLDDFKLPVAPRPTLPSGPEARAHIFRNLHKGVVGALKDAKALMNVQPGTLAQDLLEERRLISKAPPVVPGSLQSSSPKEAFSQASEQLKELGQNSKLKI